MGEEDFTPSYDSQEVVYDQINMLLDEAISLLSGQDASGITVGDDDLIYGGDVNRWIRAAYALKARYCHSPYGNRSESGGGRCPGKYCRCFSKQCR